MVKPLALVLVGSLIIAGCGMAMRQRQEAAVQRALEIGEECRQKRLAGELTSYMASVQCSNDRMRQVMAESGFRHMDLVEVYLAHRMVVARQLDEGKFTEEEAQLQTAEVYARLNSEAHRRDSADRHNRLQAVQTWNQIWANQRAYQPQPRTYTNCTSNVVGTTIFTNCY